MDSNNPLDQIQDELREMEDKTINEIVDGIHEDFQVMEQTFTEEIGVTDREPMFFIVRDPKSEIPDMPTAIIGYDGKRTDEIPKEGEALVVEQMNPDGEDPYEMLQQLDYEVLANGDSVGLMVRVCGWASATAIDTGQRPSQMPDKQNVIVTTLITDSSMHMAVRFVDEPDSKVGEKFFEVRRLDQFFDKNEHVDNILGKLSAHNMDDQSNSITGWGAMADAALAAWMTPRLLKNASPKLFSKIVEKRKK